MRRAALAVVVSGLAFGVNGAPATAGGSRTQTISYGGYEITVPASWPVYRLDSDPYRCVRYDVPAVYLGTPGADQQCPPGLIGRTQTVSLEIPPGRPAAAGGEMARSLPAVGAEVATNQAEHQFQLTLSGVDVSATYGSDPGVVRTALASLRPAPVAQEDAAQSSPAQASPQPGPEARGPAVPGHKAPGHKAPGHTGPGHAAQGRAAQVRAGRRPAAQGPSRHGPARHGPARQGPAAQVPPGQSPEWQGPPGQGLDGQGQEWQGPTGQGLPGQGQEWQGSAGQSPAVQSPAGQGPQWQGPGGQEPGGQGPTPPAPGGTTSQEGATPADGYPPAVQFNNGAEPAGGAPPAMPGSQKQGNPTQQGGIAGFDTCTAPSLHAMQVWHKQYSAAGIYIGGSDMACDYGNLNASWVQKVTTMGWTLLPVYVGPQAPCYGDGDMIDPKHAAAQGQAAAADAATKAGKFGLSQGSPIYYDMEAYDETNKSCVTAVLGFLNAWTKKLNAQGYTSGVYSSTDSGVQDLQSAASKASFTEPQAIWFAQWDGQRTLDPPGFGNRPWPVTERTKQYQGPHSQTIGGVTLQIDSDLAGGPPADNSSG